MPVSVQAVIFDVDGVLIDSLPEHLAICRDKAAEFGLNQTIPTVAEFRHKVSAGTKVSPMFYFFLAVGFPPELAQRADQDYRREFMTHYQPKAFAGIDAMLATLKEGGLKFGLVTSNIRANVVPALGNAMRYFDPHGLFFVDRTAEPKSKAWSLAECARSLKVAPQQCVYVGDQPADAAAAAEAHTQFLGVTYGWGITKAETHYRTVDSVEEIAQRLIRHHLPA